MFLAPYIHVVRVSQLVIRGALSSFIEGNVAQNAPIFVLKAPCCTLRTGGAPPTGRRQGNKVRPLGVVPLDDFLDTTLQVSVTAPTNSPTNLHQTPKHLFT